MSIPVELPSLESVMANYRFAYLMTNSEKGAPHVVQVTVTPHGGHLVVKSVGRRTRANALARPAVGLVWPPQSEADYSLIVDGQAAWHAEALQITPTRAVLHRSSPPSAPNVAGSCQSDCVELSLTAPSS